MPELPEVESLRRYLVREGMPGSVFERVVVEDKPSPEKGTGAISDLVPLPGRRVERLERRGKQIAAVLDRGVLGLHMGMTGRMVVLARGEPVPRFTRVEFALGSGTKHMRMVLADPRRWGAVRTFTDLDEAFAGLGPDALDPEFNAGQFTEAVGGRTAQIKPLLLDQSLLAGVGNIYADEALHRVGISPARRANRISGRKLEALFGAIRESLEHALEFILSHLDDRGQPFIVDAQDDRMRLLRKSGAFCPRCEIPLRTRGFGGRTAYYCGNCQH
ncbi:MAG: DNA-formamidopyrimidine glycosylase family protein [Dehalococcoidia bacterium]|jgi:formamidopyrimidine-DNA glycosylase|nr:DNA-formamidopyrimidine glycosylase family protein [Dehalococcoidia bacterium]